MTEKPKWQQLHCDNVRQDSNFIYCFI